MSVAVKNPVVKTKLSRALKPPLQQGLNIIKADNVETAAGYGWSRFNKAIETKKDSDTVGRVYVNEEVSGGIRSAGLSAGNAISSATNRQIGGFLHFGTPDHGPKTAKVMRWFSGGKAVFAKRVRGITAKNWWGLKEKSKVKIRELLSKFFGSK